MVHAKYTLSFVEETGIPYFIVEINYNHYLSTNVSYDKYLNLFKKPNTYSIYRKRKKRRKLSSGQRFQIVYFK